MPTLDTHSASSIIKLLNIGESKSGKTGALASLAKEGYRLWVLDYDNGLDIIRNVLDGDMDALRRINFETLRDRIVTQGGLPKVKAPPLAYKRAADVLTEWKADEFGPNDILVLDTLTTFSDAAFNQALFLASRLNQRPQLQDYGWMADSVKLFIEMITAPEFNCHVIVNTHVRFFGADDETQTSARGLPNAKGQEISRIVSRYFNTVVLTRSIGSGPGTRRMITTKPQGVVEVATSNPTTVKDTYPVDSGMAAMFKDILGHGPTETASAAPTKEVENAV